ncbi:MAG: hypothetical protein M3036_00205 [Bifidobacteriales bacterium]|nr:hypothetical protein [Bifidobacteriales bacterium]
MTRFGAGPGFERFFPIVSTSPVPSYRRSAGRQGASCQTPGNSEFSLSLVCPVCFRVFGLVGESSANLPDLAGFGILPASMVCESGIVRSASTSVAFGSRRRLFGDDGFGFSLHSRFPGFRRVLAAQVGGCSLLLLGGGVEDADVA